METLGALSEMTRFGLDGLIDGRFHGWIWDLLQPRVERHVSIRFGGTEVAAGMADTYREDLERAKLGTGQCAFVLPAPVSPLLLAGGLEMFANGQPMAIPDALRASIEASARAQTLARYAEVVDIQGHQLDNATVGLTIEVAAVEPECLRGLVLELRADDQFLCSVTPVPCKRTSVPVAVDGSGEESGSVEITAAMVLENGERLPMRRLSIDWQRRQPVLVGSIDGVFDGRLRGWAADKSHPSRALTLRLYVDEVPVGEVQADQHRADLAQAALGTTRCAFSLPLPQALLDGAAHSVSAYCVDTGTYLPGVRVDHVFARPAVPNRLGVPRPSFLLHAAAPVIDQAATALFPSGEIVIVSDFWPRLDAARRAGRLPTIVVPVYNAFDDIVDCFNALLAATDAAVPIVIVDDGSTDARVAPFLARMALLDQVRVLTHATNLGYTQAVNAGIRACSGNVVLLNSDTRVAPGWLGHLVAALAEHPRVGTVTAVSNNAGVFSVPEAAKDNRMPLALSDTHVARAFAYSSDGPVAVGTGNGFCMLIARDMLDDVGLFDEQAYPRGYGEENDLAMRAIAQGWRHLVTDATFVFHKRSSSFRELGGRDEIYARSQQRLRADHPYYLSYVQSLTQDPVKKRLHGSKRGLVNALNSASSRAGLLPHLKPRVLIMLHYVEEGGTALTTLDLCRFLSHHFEVLLFHKAGKVFRLSYFNAGSGALEHLMEAQLQAQPRFVDLYDEEYASLLATILRRWQIALVHVRHLMDHSRVAPRVIRSLGIPYIVSLHDFYSVCPTITLVNAEGRHCAGNCAGGERDCAEPNQWPADLGRLRGAGVRVWQRAWREVLEPAHAVVTTSAHAGSLFVDTFGDAVRSRLHVIEHGRDFPAQLHLAEAPQRDGRIRIVMLGNLLTRSKGFAVARALAALDRGRRLEFHFVGVAPPEAAEFGVVHGRYQRDRLAEIVEGIRPAFVGIFSIWPETYCHTLSESWALGIPALASSLGATGERVRAHGGGIAVDPTDVEATYQAIVAAAEPEAYAQLLRTATISNLRTLEAMGGDYVALYRDALGQRPRTSAATAGGVFEAAVAAWIDELPRPSRRRLAPRA